MAEYTANKFPAFLRDSDTYRNGDLGEALVHAFLNFDRELVKPEVKEELKELAGVQTDPEDQEDGEHDLPGFMQTSLTIFFAEINCADIACQITSKSLF